MGERVFNISRLRGICPSLLVIQFTNYTKNRTFILGVTNCYGHSNIIVCAFRIQLPFSFGPSCGAQTFCVPNIHQLVLGIEANASQYIGLQSPRLTRKITGKVKLKPSCATTEGGLGRDLIVGSWRAPPRRMRHRPSSARCLRTGRGPSHQEQSSRGSARSVTNDRWDSVRAD